MLFFLFLVVLNSFFTLPVEIAYARLKLALAIPTGAPITVANDATEMLWVVTDKTVMTYQSSQKEAIYLLSLLVISSLSLISATE